MEPARSISAWPAMLDLEQAAHYCSMSKESFEALAAHYDCRPIDLSHVPLRLLRWRTVDVQHMLDRLPQRGQGDRPPSAPPPDAAALALKLVAGQMKR